MRESGSSRQWADTAACQPVCHFWIVWQRRQRVPVSYRTEPASVILPCLPRWHAVFLGPQLVPASVVGRLDDGWAYRQPWVGRRTAPVFYRE